MAGRDTGRAVGAVLLVSVSAFLELTGGPQLGVVRGTRLVLPFGILVAATATVYLVLLLRWRHPLMVYAVIWAYSLTGLVLVHFTPFVGLVVALHAVGSRLSRRPAVVVLVLAGVPLAVSAANGALDRRNLTASVVESFTGQFALYAVVAAAGWGIGRLTFAATIRAEQQRLIAAADAIRAERLRLAREIHDIVSHSVSGMLLQAAGAKVSLGADETPVRDALTAIEYEGVRAMDELHRLLGLLRAAEDDDAPVAQGLWTLDDVTEPIRLARAAGMDVEFVDEGPRGRLDSTVSLTGYRIIQESLTNAVKYAGRGASVEVHLVWGADRLQVTVRDQVGTLPAPYPHASAVSSGLGLRGLEERVRLVGGSFTAGPLPDGFVVAAELPYAQVGHPSGFQGSSTNQSATSGC